MTSDIWLTLTTAALLGTERGPFTLPERDDALGAALAVAREGSAEHALLNAAAIVAQYAVAGQRPRAVDLANSASHTPSAHESLPLCSPAAAQRLTHVLDNAAAVLPEWLTFAAAARCLVPPEHLAALLSAGQRAATLRPLILPVIGERGRWLARLNPDWRYAATIDPADDATMRERWQTETLSVREALLRELSLRDRALMRDLVLATWTEDDAETRLAFITILGERTVPEDEALFERALDDRSRQVRQAAASALGSLPSSQFAQRMRARVAQIMSVKRGLLGKTRVTIEPPAVCDDALARDGADRKAPQGMGDRAYWLMHIAASAPLDAWTAAGATPEALVAYAAKSDWSNALLSGWSDATVRQAPLGATQAWASALIAAQPDDEGVFAALSAGEQRDLILARAGKAFHEAVDLLSRAPTVVDEQLTLALIEHLKRLIQDSELLDWRLSRSLSALGRLAPPTQAVRAQLAQHPKQDKQDMWQRIVADLRELLDLRAAMRGDFGLQ